MAEPREKFGDHQMTTWMGNLLRAGVVLSAIVIVIGGVLYLLRYGGTHPNYRLFHGEPADLRSLGAIVHFALAFHSRGFIQLGLLLLIATPVARVIFSVYGFARERDWLYVGVTLLVLAVLFYSLFWSS